MESLIISILNYIAKNVVHTIGTYVILNEMLTPKFNKWLILFINSSVDILLVLFIKDLLPEGGNLFMMIIVYVVPALIFYKERKRFCLFAAIMLVFGITLGDITYVGISYFAYGYVVEFAEPYTWTSLIFCIFSVLSILSLLFIGLVFWKKLVKKEQIITINLFAFFPLSQICFMLAYFDFYHADFKGFNNVFIYFAVIISLFSDVLMFLAVRRESRLEKTENELKTMQENMDMQLEHYNALSESFSEIRKYRHDINNIVASAELLLDTKVSKADGEAMIKEMKEKSNELIIPVYCDNPIVNAVLFQKNREAQKKNIDFSIEMLPNFVYPMQKNEICSVFANMIDNAIREAASCKDAFVKVVAKHENGMFLLNVENASDKVIDTSKSKPATTKKDKGFHGQGIEILQRIAEKYDGQFSMRSDGKCANAVFAVIAD